MDTAVATPDPPSGKYRPEPTPEQQKQLDAMTAAMTGGPETFEQPIGGGTLKRFDDQSTESVDAMGRNPGVPPFYRPGATKPIVDVPTAVNDKLLREAAWGSAKSSLGIAYQSFRLSMKYVGWAIACNWRLWRNKYGK